MEYARPIMWNVPHWAEITLYVLIPVVLVAFAAGVVWRVRKWFLGPGRAGASRASRRQLLGCRTAAAPACASGCSTALFQAGSRPTVSPWSCTRRSSGAWLVLFIGTALATVDQDFTNLLLDFQILRGKFYRLFELALDVFGVVLILGVGMAAYRRYLVRPERLAGDADRREPLGRFPVSCRACC